MSNKRDNSIKDCFKVRKGLCVDGDSTMSGGLTAGGIDIISALSKLAGIDHEHDHEHDDTGIPPELLSLIQQASACWEYPGYDIGTTTLLQTASAYYKQSELNNTIKYLHDMPLSLNIPESIVIDSPGNVPVSFALSANDTYAFEIDKSRVDFAEEENFEIEFMIKRLGDTNPKLSDLIGESQHGGNFTNDAYRIIWNGNPPNPSNPSPGNSIYGVRFIHNQTSQSCDGGDIPLETWTNVKITRENGDTIKIYYDDVEVASESGVTKALPVIAPPLSSKVKIFGGWSGGYAAPNLLLREMKVTKQGTGEPGITTCTINNHDYPPLNGAPASDTGTNRVLYAHGSTSNADGDGIPTRANEVVPYFYGDGTKDWAGDAQFVGVPENSHSVTPFVSGSSYGDSSIHFDGSSYIKWEQDEYVRDTFFNIGDSDFTYELWFRTDNLDDRQPLFSTHEHGNSSADAGSDAISCEINSADNLYFHFRKSDQGSLTTSVDIPIEPLTWYHLAAVRKDNMLYMYVNGKLENTPVAWVGQPRINNVSNAPLPFQIGRYWTKRFQGHIQDFRYTQEAVYAQDFQECLTAPGTTDETMTIHYSPTGTVVAQYADCAPESTGGAGGSGVFVTDLTSDGITNKTIDDTQVAIGNYAPVVSAVVDDPNLHFTVEWEGASDEWTGYPTVSGHTILKTETSAIAGDQTIRRFRAVKSIDFTDYKGETIIIPIEFKGSSYSIDVEIAGEGPVATSITCDNTYPHGQDHFKAGDELTLTITFDSTDVQGVTLHSGSNLATQNVTLTDTDFESSTIVAGKRVIVLKTTLNSGAFSSNILKNLDVKVTGSNSLGTTGAEYTEPAIVPGMLGPVITNITFDANPYPGEQTEFKTGDTVNVHFTFDTNNVNRVYFSNDENTTNNTQKSINTTNKTGSVSVGVSTSHASDTSTFAKSVKAKAQSTASGYTYGDYKVSTDTINVNNQYPQVLNNGVTYPGGQNGIKAGEVAQVSLEARYVGADPSYLYAHPTGQLKNPPVVGGPGPGDLSHAADVYVLPKRTEYNSGDYNISTPNMSLTVTRKENGASTTGTAVVNIANVSPTITITSNNGTRMRSGGNDGTSAQNYSVRIDSDQQLTNTPSIVVPVGSIGSWSANSQKTRYTSTLSVHDNDAKGIHTYTGMSATGITGLSTNVISSGADYVFGGFVSRVVNISAPGQPDAYINVLWSDYNKLSLTWSTGVQIPNKAPAGTTNQITSTWAVVSQTAPDTGTTPVEVRILDYSATGAISTPSTVTIEEVV